MVSFTIVIITTMMIWEYNSDHVMVGSLHHRDENVVQAKVNNNTINHILVKLWRKKDTKE